jgi:excisionase family DNA binding protein
MTHYPQFQKTDEVMTSTEAASYLKMHVKTICRLAKEGKIPARKVGSEWRFMRSVLDKWLTYEPEFV